MAGPVLRIVPSRGVAGWKAWSEEMSARIGELAHGTERGTARRNLAASLLIFVLAIGLAACSNDDTYLPALLADPMASYEAEGLVLSDSWEHAQRPSVLGAAPRQASVNRSYRIEDQAEAEELLDTAVAFAESEGWTMGPAIGGDPNLFRGTKELVPGSGELTIALGAADPISDPDGPRQLNIHLNFDPVPTED